MNPTTHTNGQAVAALRRVRGWTVEETARAAGISRPHLSNIERGAKAPSAEVAAAIAAAFGVDVSVIFPRTPSAGAA